MGKGRAHDCNDQNQLKSILAKRRGPYTSTHDTTLWTHDFKAITYKINALENWVAITKPASILNQEDFPRK